MSDYTGETDHEGRFDNNKEHAHSAGKKAWHSNRDRLLERLGVDVDELEGDDDE